MILGVYVFWIFYISAWTTKEWWIEKTLKITETNLKK